MNVIGDPIDERGPINTKKRYPIHREAPSFDEQGSGAEIKEGFWLVYLDHGKRYFSRANSAYVLKLKESKLWSK